MRMYQASAIAAVFLISPAPPVHGTAGITKSASRCLQTGTEGARAKR